MEDQKNQGLGKLFVSYEIAKKLDYLQFNEECLAFFDEDNNLQIGGSFKNSSMLKGFTAPLYQQVLDWLFQKHNISLVYQVTENKTILNMEIEHVLKFI